VTSAGKAELIGKKFPGVTGTTDLDAVLADPEVKGVFVAASPEAHFSISQKVLQSGKSLFVEKPPVRNSRELEVLIGMKKGIATAG
jgi:virulence factor